MFVETEGRLMELWLLDTKLCVLCSVDDALEVRLYDHGKLVGLEPCRTAQDALAISNKWRATPPTWPPY
jgi:hypothetical protein